jgi:hypothetical protein
MQHLILTSESTIVKNTKYETGSKQVQAMPHFLKVAP